MHYYECCSRHFPWCTSGVSQFLSAYVTDCLVTVRATSLSLSLICDAMRESGPKTLKHGHKSREAGTKNHCAGEGQQQFSRVTSTSQTPHLIVNEAPFQNTLIVSKRKIWGSETKNYCAGEGRQQFNRPTERPTPCSLVEVYRCFGGT
jgi:hypothetical protein